jgi:hypothetical protein
VAVPKWEVEITVEGFGPSHPLWNKFAERANRLNDASLEWELEQSADLLGGNASIRATIESDTPEAAIRRVMKRVRDIGEQVDREDLVRWEHVTGKAQLPSEAPKEGNGQSA